ncbi:hypothetical protein LSAT2_004750 [Lamellibrachia satsuma]|nr:hypothetical protein LSAT2_004750 [Lamellibrachia satsuma]
MRSLPCGCSSERGRSWGLASEGDIVSAQGLRPPRDASRGATAANEQTRGACYLRCSVLSFYLVLSTVSFVSHGISLCDAISAGVPEGTRRAAA